MTFDTTWKQVASWLNKVETCPVMTGENVDFENVQEQLNQHKV